MWPTEMVVSVKVVPAASFLLGWLEPSQGWTWSDVAAQVTACLLTLHVATGQLGLSAFHLILLLPTVAQADIDVDNLLDDQPFSKASWILIRSPI